MRRDRRDERRAKAGEGLRRAAAAIPLVLLACATSAPEPEPLLEPRDVATHASEFFCAQGRWPGDAAELAAFPAPATPRTRLEPRSGAIPWPLLHDAAFETEPGGALRVRAELPPGRVAGQPPERPVALRLRVERPGCWPPRAAEAGSEAGGSPP